jgi:hypothetical protein
MNPFWYQLLKEDGTSMGSADAVTLPADSLVFQFRKQVKAENTHGITIDARELTVYENKTAYDSKELQMKSSASVAGLGWDEENALVVVVPNPNLRGITVNVNSRRETNGIHMGCDWLCEKCS